ncbi:helix-turn-helix domain-containing protein [Leptospira weilii]|uniref:helix-turn-helix domain-containing protein n=1 Tax=Leptospira weilii TaxID=28184 RepID=UPI000773048F|nr:helix-turn-helix transcriptional regulator [Leptospira weilii]
MSDRIRVLLKALGVTQKEFADNVGISQGFVSEIINGKNVPSHETLARIAFKYRVNLNWLINGEGEMFIPQRDELYKYSDENRNIMFQIHQKPEMFEFIKSLLDASDDQWERIREIVKLVLKK